MSSKEMTAFLSRSPAFAGLPPREIEALAGVAMEERHRARATVFMEGDPAHWFYLVKTGHVKIVRHSKTGKDVVLELLGPGEVFGGVAVIEKRAYPAAAEATESTVVVKIPADPMIALADRHPSFIREMARLIGQRLRAAHDSVTSLAVDPRSIDFRPVRCFQTSGRSRGGYFSYAATVCSVTCGCCRCARFM